ncbi:MAG: hypothetical protein R2698_11660 [Microthrixaceae bacterium]
MADPADTSSNGLGSGRSPGGPPGGRAGAKQPKEHIAELKSLVVGYAKQETIDPLKSLKRYLLFGLAGSVALSFGVFLLLLGVLRMLQAYGPMHDSRGAWSLVPYAGTAIVAVLTVVAAATGIKKDHRRSQTQ